jgi:hypothetical protein
MLEAGAAVTCGICGKDATIMFIAEREGGLSYDLTGCRHRNAMCPNCNVLVRDDSDRIEAIVPLCKTCNPEAFVEDDEDDE